jgi:PIN domain nuclease of toxin-antitoxin system
MTWLEWARLCSTGQVGFSTGFEAFLSEVERRFVVLPMNGRICVQAFGLPATYPQDPADRIIGATALVEGLSLVTVGHRRPCHSHARSPNNLVRYHRTHSLEGPFSRFLFLHESA